MAQNIPRGTPARVLVIFTLLSAGVAFMTWRESRRRSQIETISHPTAAGDVTFFKAADSFPEVTLAGHRYRLRGSKNTRLQRRDDRMYVVPAILSDKIQLYTTHPPVPTAELPPFYLKTAHGEYLRVRLIPLRT